MRARVILIGLALVLAWVAFQTHENKKTETVSSTPSTSQEAVSKLSENQESPLSNPRAAAWQLDSSNFEYTVQKCFQGEPCELQEDPLSLYDYYKKTGNRKVNDLLISYLRKNLSDPEFKARYKDKLKTVIEDFYPPEEKQFQLAAYYNYLGNLEKSLTLYLDLEKKAAANPTLRPAPKLNIANTYHDLGRQKEALSYYKAALVEFETKFPNQHDVIAFIRRRIGKDE